jgi:hypothetical protein
LRTLRTTKIATKAKKAKAARPINTHTAMWRPPTLLFLLLLLVTIFAEEGSKL